MREPAVNPNGSPTRNGLIFEAAEFKRGKGDPQLVKVYERIRPGLWDHKGMFKLVDAWQEITNGRKVFKFKLELLDQA